MHPVHVREKALTLIEEGLNDCEVGRRLGIPRSTVRWWRVRPYCPKPTEPCFRCWRNTKPIRFTPAEYAELLGLYLGDGSISDLPRTARLRIHLDAKYPDIIRETSTLLRRVFPANPVGLVKPEPRTMVYLSVYSSHLACLFPQHGDGMKHERRIALEPWQLRLVEEAPWSLLRGFIRSDGSVFVNRTGPYEYLSYDFSNRSRDIVDLFTSACGAVGVEYRANWWRRIWRVRINRRASVARMLAEVGTKS